MPVMASSQMRSTYVLPYASHGVVTCCYMKIMRPNASDGILPDAFNICPAICQSWCGNVLLYENHATCQMPVMASSQMPATCPATCQSQCGSVLLYEDHASCQMPVIASCAQEQTPGPPASPMT
eukprot:1161984-Pelagomonas_calceolata.AAC.7